MKKIIVAALAALTASLAFTACDKLPFLDNIVDSSKVQASYEEVFSDTTLGDSTESKEGLDSSVETSESNESSDSSSVGGTDAYLYHAFTASEKTLFTEKIGEVIPFVANNEYYVEEYALDWETEYEIGVHFYTFGNTQAEFNAYRALFTGYTLDDSDVDDYGDTWYYYSKGDFYVDMAYYVEEGESIIDVYAYCLVASNPDDDSSSSGSGTDTYLYTAFTSTEKALFKETIGEVIPFVANNEYYVEEYEMDLETEYEIGINFYTYGNTEAEFNSYKASFTGYTFDGSDQDDYGDTWYYYSKGDFYVDMAYYETENGYVIDVYAYCLYESNPNPGSGNEGNDTPEDIEIITNAGKGLPTSANGVYNVDFTKATNVKDVTDQGYYLDGCPTTGKPQVLVIPVEFSDVTAASKSYSIDKIKQAFNGSEANATYYSVWEYYYLSSYGALDVEFTVLDDWFMPKNKSDYYRNYIDTVSGQEIGDQVIIDEALAALEGKMDLSKFDSDNNSIIDAVILINTLDVNDNEIFYWAYRYWNIYTDADGNYYEYDGVSANDYLWASYQFMLETYDEEGNPYYNNSVMNTYTYIHEFGHVLGADDYYDTAYVGAPLDYCDVMDSMPGDHNPYTKFNYGWLTSSRLVVAEESVTLTLEAFSESGDTIIIANNWDESLGAYQEYYVIMYYKNVELNSAEMGGGYFARDGILVYHVNASLYKEVYEGETYYDVYNNNTDPSDESGTEDNLIEYIKSPADTYTYVEGDYLANDLIDDQGNKIAYTFTVDSMTDKTATLTFTKNN